MLLLRDAIASSRDRRGDMGKIADNRSSRAVKVLPSVRAVPRAARAFRRAEHNVFRHVRQTSIRTGSRVGASVTPAARATPTGNRRGSAREILARTAKLFPSCSPSPTPFRWLKGACATPMHQVAVVVRAATGRRPGRCGAYRCPGSSSIPKDTCATMRRGKPATSPLIKLWNDSGTNRARIADSLVLKFVHGHMSWQR
jgi:hypothetical protein